MENDVKGNETNSQKPEDRDYTYHDWREERRQWRHEMRERRHRWPFHGLFVGLTLVLFGVLFLLNQTGHLTGDAWWQSMLIGLGAISIVDGLARYTSPGYRWGAYSKVVAGIVLVLIGTLFLVGFSQWWPVVLIVAGAAFLARFFWRRINVLP